ncbi:MAG: lysine--tRNA ligase [Candidatus Nanoarchaeia archaeon]|nr:lysine--tRNA ligase [Candidatus Nanoarchaeia archaeon]
MAEDHLIQERKNKVDELKEIGINPYPYNYKITKHSKQIKEENKDLASETKTEIKESVAGRIVLFRRMGKASFLTIQDEDGQIQAYLRSDDIGEEKYDLLKKIELGDIIGVRGKVFTTKTGEISIYVEDFELLCKSIKSLPDKFHGIQDMEIKYRKRHLDLIMNSQSKEIFKKRLLIMQAIREFMISRGFLEVETPILQEQYGGAAAKPFKTFHNDLKMEMFLRISPELYLKKLLVGGFEKVFDINKNFRNESIDTTHNPEFTMMEAYQAYADYEDMMDLMENLYDFVAKKVLGTTKVMFKGQEIDVKAPWDRVTMLGAIEEYAGIDATNMSKSDLEDFIIKNNIEFDKELNWGNLVAAIFEHFCEDKFINPTFVIDHPRETSPLCKKLRTGDERLIERFEPFCMGMELGNAYSELNDPIEQRRLLEDQQRQLNAGNEEANPIDESFLDAIDTGMPPAGGIGVGIDRMIMILLGQESIRDIIFFPTMKPEQKTVNSESEDRK